MASVLFSTVGQAVGGPLGAGIGLAVGASVDSSVFGRGRRGAQDGFAIRSAYGEGIPFVFGRTRVGGQVIWATSPAVAGSKGGGRRARSTSFAVAVSRGPIGTVGRIWADGSLLRNADGELLSDTEFRVHSAGQSQADPLIAAAEGDAAPAYVQLSYIVFENFDLGPYGNRIPSLSFEVEAEAGSVSEWLEQLTRSIGAHVDVAPTAQSIEGYAARLDPFAEDFSALLAASGRKVGLRDGRLSLLHGPRTISLSRNHLVASGGEADEAMMIRQDVRPSGVGLAFQDLDRDYQLGWQQELRAGRGAVLSLSWPAAASASAARTIALRLFQDSESGADTIRFAVSHRFLDLNVGDMVNFGDQRLWLVVRKEVQGLTILLEGRRVPRTVPPAVVPSDPGRVLHPPSTPAPPSITMVVEPPVPIWRGSGASVVLAVSGGSGWRGADVEMLQGGDPLLIGTARETLPFGELDLALEAGPATIWDERNSLVVNVVDQESDFSSRSRSDVLDGGGLICVGEELLQYRDADVVGPTRIRLSGLLRGRFGTSASGWPAGTRVMAVPRVGAVSFDVAPDMLGRQLRFLVAGAGDSVGGSPVSHIVSGSGGAPLAPVHVRGGRRPDGGIVCGWVERKRAYWQWDVPDAFAPAHRYVWQFRAGSGRTLGLEAGASGIQLDMAAQIEAFGGALPAGEFRVEAVGDGPEAVRISRWMAI